MLGSNIRPLNRLSETVASTATHRDLALRLADEKAIALVNSQLEEMEPFDKINAQNILISLSPGFTVKTAMVSMLKRLTKKTVSTA